MIDEAERSLLGALLRSKTGVPDASVSSAAFSGLRAAGFALQHSGGRIVIRDEPERLTPVAIAARMSPTVIGRDISVLEETSSTQDRVKQAGAGGAEEGLAIFAEAQKAGRGRFGRSWVSAPGQGLWFSVLLRLPGDVDFTESVREAALAVRQAIQPFVSARVDLKWPNDLMIHGSKVAGLLLEVSADFQVLGCGINVRTAPSAVSYQAAALDDIARVPIVRAALAAEILVSLDQWYDGVTKRAVPVRLSPAAHRLTKS